MIARKVLQAVVEQHVDASRQKVFDVRLHRQRTIVGHLSRNIVATRCPSSIGRSLYVHSGSDIFTCKILLDGRVVEEVVIAAKADVELVGVKREFDNRFFDQATVNHLNIEVCGADIFRLNACVNDV